MQQYSMYFHLLTNLDTLLCDIVVRFLLTYFYSDGVFCMCAFNVCRTAVACKTSVLQKHDI